MEINRKRLVLAIASFAAVGAAVGYFFVFNTNNEIRRRIVARRLNIAADSISAGRDIDSNQSLILSSFKSDWTFERLFAIGAVRHLGKKGCFALDEVIDSLRSDIRLMRREAALAISEMGSCASRAGPDLAILVKHETGDVSAFAARAIGSFGADGRAYLDLLHAVTADAHVGEMVKDEAEKAIRRIRTDR